MIPIHIRQPRLSRADRENRKTAWRETRGFDERRRYGSPWLASECQRLDPATGAVIGIVERDDLRPAPSSTPGAPA